MGYLIEDLRFCIGAFFVIVGGLLTTQGLMDGTLVEGVNLNLWTGLMFLVFGGCALALSLRGATFGKGQLKSKAAGVSSAKSQMVKAEATAKKSTSTNGSAGKPKKPAGTQKSADKKKRR